MATLHIKPIQSLVTSHFISFAFSGGLLVLMLSLVLGLFAIELIQPTDDIRDAIAAAPVWVRWPAYYALVTVVLTLGVFSQSPFIYFQF